MKLYNEKYKKSNYRVDSELKVASVDLPIEPVKVKEKKKRRRYDHLTSEEIDHLDYESDDSEPEMIRRMRAKLREKRRLIREDIQKIKEDMAANKAAEDRRRVQKLMKRFRLAIIDCVSALKGMGLTGEDLLEKNVFT